MATKKSRIVALFLSLLIPASVLSQDETPETAPASAGDVFAGEDEGGEDEEPDCE